jgi:hypothetical protein
MKLKEYQNMVYLNLLGVNLFATVTNKRNYVAKRLADDFMRESQ